VAVCSSALQFLTALKDGHIAAATAHGLQDVPRLCRRAGKEGLVTRGLLISFCLVGLRDGMDCTCYAFGPVWLEC
jgi:hypothetical protein